MPHCARNPHFYALNTSALHPLLQSSLVCLPSSHVQHSAAVFGLIVSAHHLPTHSCAFAQSSPPHHLHALPALVPARRSHVSSPRLISTNFCCTSRAPLPILRADNIVLHPVLPHKHFTYTTNSSFALAFTIVVGHYHSHIGQHSWHIILVYSVFIYALCPVRLHNFLRPLLLPPFPPFLQFFPQCLAISHVQVRFVGHASSGAPFSHCCSLLPSKPMIHR